MIAPILAVEDIDRSFSVKDPDGYYLSLCQTIEETDMERVRAIMRGESS